MTAIGCPAQLHKFQPFFPMFILASRPRVHSTSPADPTAQWVSKWKFLKKSNYLQLSWGSLFPVTVLANVFCICGSSKPQVNIMRLSNRGFMWPNSSYLCWSKRYLSLMTSKNQSFPIQKIITLNALCSISATGWSPGVQSTSLALRTSQTNDLALLKTIIFPL